MLILFEKIPQILHSLSMFFIAHFDVFKHECFYLKTFSCFMQNIEAFIQFIY